MNAFKAFFSKLLANAAANPKTSIAGIAGVAAVIFPKYASYIAAASTAVVGALAQDASSSK